jgi:hypothetical protein
MSLDVYELIRIKKITNLEILSILAFLETLCEERGLIIPGVFQKTTGKTPDMRIQVNILRMIDRIDKNSITNLKRRDGTSGLKSREFLSSPQDLDELRGWSTQQYYDVQSFVLEWIELNMCETEFSESENSQEKLYHAAHLSIPRIYATILSRETFDFYSRVRTTYRDSYDVSRTPTFNEELELNDYTKWGPDAILPAFDKDNILRFITPFKMKVYIEDGVTYRELVGGDIVIQPTVSTIVNSFKQIFKAEGSLGTVQKQWYQALSLQYKGMYWDNNEDLVRLPPNISRPGKVMDSSIVSSNVVNGRVVYNNKIFVNQMVTTLSKIIETYNGVLDQIIQISPNITVEKSQDEITSIARRVGTIQNVSQLVSASGLIEGLSAAKYTVLGVTMAMVITSGITRYGIRKFYDPTSGWTGNFYPYIRNAGGKIIKNPGLTDGIRKIQQSRIASYDKLIGRIDHNILAPLKYAYSIANILEGNISTGIGTAAAVYGVSKLSHTPIVQEFLLRIANSKVIGKVVTPVAFLTATEIVLITIISEIVSLGVDYTLQLLDERQKNFRRFSAQLIGYAPDAFANYDIRIPMSQFGHIVDVAVMKQFLNRQEVKDGDNITVINANPTENDSTSRTQIINGSTNAVVDDKFKNYYWARREILDSAPPEGLWPINFAPIESIQRAKSGIKLDFDKKIEKQQQHPDLKTVPPKLESSEEVGLFFPNYPWGITPSVCIPTFEDAAKESVKTNLLAQQDLNNIYEYNEFMNTVGKIITTPDGLEPNISKITSISYTDSYVNSLSQELVHKLVRDTADAILESDIESENGEFTQNNKLFLNDSGNTLIINPHRKVFQSEEITLTSKPSIRPNSENKSKDGKNIAIGERISNSDYVKKSLKTYFPNNPITRPFNNDYNSNVPPITVDIRLPSYANGNALRDVSSTDPLVRVLTQTERNVLRSSSSPGSVSNIEDHILTDVSIKLGASGPKLDTDLFEKGCELKRPERGDKPTRPDTGPNQGGTGPGVRTCFPSYVKILTPNGYMEISGMNIGDKITAFDENGNLVESIVTHKFIHDGEEMSEVFEYELSNGNKLHITDNHPVLVPSGEFLQIGWLNIGDSVVGENNEEIQIISKKFVEKTIVYNLEVEKYHTYIAEGIRVHNLTNKWAGKGSGFDPRMGGRRPGFIIIDSSEWENGGGQGDDTKNSEAGNQEAVGSGRDNPFIPTCFPSWSIVTTENGKKPISEISVGDKIFTLNRESGKIETSVVTDVKKHEDENHSVSRYELSDGGHIDITKNHPVLTPSGYFKSICKLTIGDLIITENGESVSIINEYHLDDCHVYNLQVESNGSYIVDGIVVSDR